MLKPEDRQAIENLFERLRNVEARSEPRDADAEALIAERLRQHPAAAYFMAQTIVVQEAALREQQARLSALEHNIERGRGGFLGGIFGGETPLSRPNDDYQQPERRRGPWGSQPSGGFLAGAAQTALGVTGGLLLGSAIAGMFDTPVQAEELPVEDAQDTGGDQGTEDGSDWGGDDFDIGGEF
jgi:uncharacterized protein